MPWDAHTCTHTRMKLCHHIRTLCCKGTEVCVCMKDAQKVQVDFFFLTASKSPRRVHSLEGGAGNRWVVV